MARGVKAEGVSCCASCSPPLSLSSQGRYGCCRFLRDGYRTPKEVRVPVPRRGCPGLRFWHPRVRRAACGGEPRENESPEVPRAASRGWAGLLQMPQLLAEVWHVPPVPAAARQRPPKPDRGWGSPVRLCQRVGSRRAQSGGIWGWGLGVEGLEPHDFTGIP